MDEYASLAQRVVLTMDDVRGCLVLSRDGLVLGAFPEDEEAAVKPAWLKFTHVGEVRRSFVEFADQIWAFIHRGPYSAFVVASTAIRPGVLLDQLEQALLVAEETRARRETLKVPDAAAAPSGRPRTSLHPPADRPEPAEVAAAPTEAVAQVPIATGPWKRPSPSVEPIVAGSAAPADEPRGEVREPSVSGLRAPATPEHGMAPEERAPAFASSPFAEFARDEVAVARSGDDEGPAEEVPSPVPNVLVSPPPDAAERPDDAAEIDRVMLAKEFSGLLQLDADDDEARS